MFKSVICVGEDFTVDLTGPTYKYWTVPDPIEFSAVMYYRWDGTKMMVRTSGPWVDACATYDELLIAGTPCDANTAEIPTQHPAGVQ